MGAAVNMGGPFRTMEHFDRVATRRTFVIRFLALGAELLRFH
jgi:hypothetical protein